MRLLAPGFGGGRGSRTRRVGLDSAQFGDKTIRVGQRLKGRVVSSTKYGAFVSIGLKKDGLIRRREAEALKEGQEVYVEVISLTKDPRRGILIDLSLVEILVSPSDVPSEEQAYCIGREGNASVIEIKRIGQGLEICSLPDRLSLTKYKTGDFIQVIRTGIKSREEIYSAADFVPIAQALFKAISAKRKFRAKTSLRKLSPLDTGRKNLKGHVGFLVTAADRILEGVEYFPEGVLIVPEYSAGETRDTLNSGEYHFFLEMEWFNARTWTVMSLIRTMAAKPLRAFPA
jgi:hypothetical protein